MREDRRSARLRRAGGNTLLLYIARYNHFAWRSSAILILFFWSAIRSFAAGTGELELNVIDADLRESIAVRMHLKDQRGRPVRVRGFATFHDHFLFDGKAVLKLPVGEYTFEMERGIEYRTRTGKFSIARGAADNKTVEMHRFADMAAEGWYSGDLDVNRPTKDMGPLMLAEDLRVAIVAGGGSKSADQKDSGVSSVGDARFYAFAQAAEKQAAGVVSVISISPVKAIRLPATDYPWNYFTDSDRRDEGYRHIDLATCQHSELPVWLASRQVDSLGVLNGLISRDGREKSDSGRVPDPVIYAPPHGSGRWSCDIYYNVLNSGFRIPPSAGSGSGESTNPVGYNRVYVHCGEGFTYENWWRNFREGKCVVTNGPVLRVSANGELPGHIFRAAKDEELAITASVKLSTREKISYLQIVKDGESVHEVRLEQFVNAGGQLPSIRFRESGWLMVRAVCDNAMSYRCAFSGPFYVEFGEKPRISRRSTRFFLDWVKELADSSALGDRRRYYESAVRYWERRLAEANVE